jgi:hypothetical protein
VTAEGKDRTGKASKGNRERPSLVPRPPPPPVSPALEAFVEGKALKSPPEGSGTRIEVPLPAAGTRAPRGRVKRAGGREAARVTIYLPPEIADRLRVYAAVSGLELSEVVGPAICAVVAQLPDKR